LLLTTSRLDHCIENELIAAYKALIDAVAPFAYLEIMINAYGLDEAVAMVDAL